MDNLEFEREYKKFLNGTGNKTPLELSIMKWELITENKLKDDGIFNCALCEEYHDGGCYDCPIFKITGKNFCKDTPYSIFRYHVDNCRFCEEEHENYCTDAKELAKMELDYLKFVQKCTKTVPLSGSGKII